jgi:hypothetical protein
MNPIAGLDLVRTNTMKDIKLKEGKARILVDLPTKHQFAASIKDEIEEKITPLRDMKEVKVDFTE